MLACKNSGFSIDDCFPEVRKSIVSGKGRKSSVVDYQLTRYACYLIVQNGDPRKEIIALALEIYGFDVWRPGQASGKIGFGEGA
jgi:DNA-damage-inducible protein D